MLFSIGGHLMKKMVLLIIGILLFSSFGVVIANNNEADTEKIHENLNFSMPEAYEQDDYINIQIKEATTYMEVPGNPSIPIYVMEYKFPLGTQINKVTATFSDTEEIIVSKEIQPVPQRTPTNTEEVNDIPIYEKNNEIYSSDQFFPLERLSYQVGAGIEATSHILFLTVRYYPVVYSPQKSILLFTPEVQIDISYSPVQKSTLNLDDYNLVIIAPEEYEHALQPLIAHKISYGFKTLFKSTEDIYQQYNGRDDCEKIKYFIKDSLDTYGVSYVMLVGSIYKVPIRSSYISWWDIESVLTDLYYSDIYDSNLEFSSWDTNNNDIFGDDEDIIDHYPDIHIGRLACENVHEVDVVVDKIIHYETETFNQDWFDKMIYIGGDTFPRFWGWFSGNEGEVNNEYIMNIMTDFEPSHIIWTSKGNYNRKTISGAINEGAGFLDYSGHGFEHGMGTYRPHGRILKFYFTSYIKDLVNGYKLPIIFFDACLTATLDFTLENLLEYKGFKMFKIFTLLPNIDPSMRLSCYAWSYISHEGGGAIATIGATRTAFGGMTAGAGKLSFEFFKSYDSSTYLGEMMTSAQNSYISDVPDDSFTLEEFILLGDPTLKIGGYSQDKIPPKVEILNPAEGYFHVFGERLMELPIVFDFMYGTMAFGGFRLNPLQIQAIDDTDLAEDLKINIYIDDINKGTAEYNQMDNLFYYKWSGPGLGFYDLKVTAEDKSGNIGSSEMSIWYFCLFR